MPCSCADDPRCCYYYGYGVGAAVEPDPDKNPDVLYTAALGELRANVNVTKSFSPLAQEVFHAADHVLEQAIGSDSEKLAEFVLKQAVDAIGSETLTAVSNIVSTIATAVADYVPLVGVVVSMFSDVLGGVAQETEARKQSQAEAEGMLLSRPLLGSAVGNRVQPSDIFAPDPVTAVPKSVWEEASYQTTQAQAGKLIWSAYRYMPYSALGVLLAAVTEDSGDYGVAPNGFVSDTNLHHSIRALELAPTHYVQFLMMSNMPNEVAAHPNVGLPPERRRAYQLLRRAIGSRNDDQGRSLWPLYMDMLLTDVRSGRLTGSYMVWLLTHRFTMPDGGTEADGSFEYTGPTGGNIHSLPLESMKVFPYVNTILSLVDQWEATQAKARQRLAQFHGQFVGPMGRTITSEVLHPASKISAKEVAAGLGLLALLFFL
jgi:hypothetical protein